MLFDVGFVFVYTLHHVCLLKECVCLHASAHAHTCIQTHSRIPSAAAMLMLLLLGEWVPCPHHLVVTPTLRDVAAPLETGRVPIIYMP